MLRAPESGFPGCRAADRHAMSAQSRQRRQSSRYSKLACSRPHCPRPVDPVGVLQLGLLRRVDPSGSQQKPNRLIVSVQADPPRKQRRLTSRITMEKLIVPAAEKAKCSASRSRKSGRYREDVASTLTGDKETDHFLDNYWLGCNAWTICLSAAPLSSTAPEI